MEDYEERLTWITNTNFEAFIQLNAQASTRSAMSKISEWTKFLHNAVRSHQFEYQWSFSHQLYLVSKQESEIIIK